MKKPLTCLLAALFITVGYASAAEKPNIVMIISEDQGWRDSGCYGNPDLTTPHIDRLAREGMRFTHAFAATSLCSPSRAVIATGLMPYRNGGHIFGGHVKPGTKAIGHLMRDPGYETASIGKHSRHPRRAFPYDHLQAKWSVEDGDAAIIGMVDKFLEERDAARPLYLEINTARTHMPWPENKEFDTSALTVPPHLVDTGEMRRALAEYYTAVQLLDESVGEILATLEKRGYRENTLLIYTSDHGPNFPFAKWCLYDEGVRVPFIAVWPGVVEPGTTTDAMVSLADIVPTLVEVGSGAAPEDLDGRSFLGVLNGQQKEHQQAVFGIHSGHHQGYPAWKSNRSPARSIRTRTHRYILNLNPTQEFVTHITTTSPERQPSAYHPYWDTWLELAKTDGHAATRVRQYLHRPQHELYDLTNDPFETNNIADLPENAELLKQLQQQLSDWRETQGDDVPVYGADEYRPPNVGFAG